MAYAYAFGAVIIVSLLSFTGALILSIRPEKLKKITIHIVSLSAGTLLGGSFLHLLPEAFGRRGSGESVLINVLAGILIFFLLEKIICWRHCHVPTSREHPHALGLMNLIGDGLHNFLDGIVIAGSFLVSVPLGITTTLAVIAHEIPQEMADFGVLIHAGYEKSKALMLNFLIALTAVLGAAVTFALQSRIEDFSAYIIPLTAGGFIYIATADLIPELKKDIGPKYSFYQFTWIMAGVLLMAALKYAFEH